MNFWIHLLKMSIRSSMSLKLAFLIESLFMIGNNVIFLAIWWFFFRQFKSVGGWDFHDMIVLNIIVSGAYGISRVCFGGIKGLSRAILNSGLDVFMIQPVNVLLHFSAAKSQSKGWGHIITAIVLYLFNLKILFFKSFLLAIGILGGAIVFSAFGVIVHSLPFWFGSIEEVSKKYADSLVMFVQYPLSIYSGVLQLVMYTVLPAGIIGFLPVEMVRDFSWVDFWLFLSAVASFAFLASFIFYQGLRNYESGN